MTFESSRRPCDHRWAHRVAASVLVAATLLSSARTTAAHAAWIWVEGEKPVRARMFRHPSWYDKVKKDQLSGADLISNFHQSEPGEALYRVIAPETAVYEFWVRANPVKSRLHYKINDGPWTYLDMSREVKGSINIAADDKPDLRYLAWANAGSVKLQKGPSTVRFRMDSASSNHGYLDCFVFSTEPFSPRGAAKPDQLEQVAERDAQANPGWFPFEPKPDRYSATSAIDLRFLNEKRAGEGGVIAAKDGRFVHSKTAEPVRFWGVNGPAGKESAAVRAEARLLAKRGVNLARIHHGYYNDQGELDMAAIRQAIAAVEALQAEGIYTHLSIYFPLWLRPGPANRWLEGYDGSRHPFAALFFNPKFQKQYQSWWRALLLTPSPATGKRLVDDPAVAGLEIQNEDSLFFWTFPDQVPDTQLRILETRFGDWLKSTFGSIDAGMKRWGGTSVPRDKPSEGRVGFRPLWNLFNEKSPRDKDTVRFLYETQRGFYQEQVAFLRGLGFKGLITASNWITASPEMLTPLEKESYLVGDFIDRHGYLSCFHKGKDAEWSLQDGQTYRDRSALRFDNESPATTKVFNHPAMDPSYDDKPSMISETTWTRPNRYRSEGPLFYAAYGALQGSDAIVHFAFDGASWSVKPGFFMQPWTLMSPAMSGQFPAAALLYRKGLVAEGDLLVDLDLKKQALLELEGTPMPQDASLDELRQKDMPVGPSLRKGDVIDPLVHFAGRTAVRFTEQGGTTTLKDLKPYVDHTRKTVTSTTGELKLDYGKGLLTINAPAAQGASGTLRDAGPLELKDLSIASGMTLGHIVAVSLDGRPLAESRKVLLQVMSEEKAAGFRAEPAEGGVKKISSIGRDPWMVMSFQGSVRLKRPDAAKLKVTALDGNGDPVRAIGTADEIKLAPTTLYYLIQGDADR